MKSTKYLSQFLIIAVCFLVALVGCAPQEDPAEAQIAYKMKLSGDWKIDGDLPIKAMLISLQGIANAKEPMLYLVYPPGWPYNYTPHLLEYLDKERGFTFKEIQSPVEALAKLKWNARGYVVWDKSERTSLIVAFTVAGLEDAVVVSEELIPLAEAAGLKMIEDFRGKFTGQSDLEIYQWAYDTYWHRCDQGYVTYMGGAGGNQMMPGIADYGMYRNSFFTDLSADPEDTLEFKLTNRILSEMNPLSLVLGWHSYVKDTEAQHITLLSSYQIRQEGLNTYPNMSFMTHIPVEEGFEFKNNHNVTPDSIVVPERRVYITCIQTDGLGIGAYHKPGRGEIPYAWEVTMIWLETAPAMLEYFYKISTPNDYFIGALGGPTYMYPKPTPREALPKMIGIADSLRRRLDLRVFEIMDYSEGNRYMGNIDLPKDVVDAYYQGMPDVIGFINGYGPAHTFDMRDQRPFLSYDYYLSAGRPDADVVGDLRELATMNEVRPYYLVMHVRENSDIQRVKGILDRLGPEFEIVPLDVLLRMAAHTPTITTRHLNE
jgi:hypothetical protein